MSKLSFGEAVVISWKKEMKIGNPWRILQLAFFTLVYGSAYCFYVVPRNQIYRFLFPDDSNQRRKNGRS